MSIIPGDVRIGIALSLAILTGSWLSLAATSIPNADLEITVRQKEKGKTDKGLHLFELSCWNDECSLTVLSLNQCAEGSRGRRAFERSSTKDGALKVVDLGGVLEVQDTHMDIGGESRTTLRIGYEKVGTSAKRVTSFSGGYVKNSDLLKSVVTVDYVPLRGGFEYVDLDCAVMLPGVETRE